MGIWKIMGRANIRVKEIEIGKESQLKAPKKYFQRNHRRKFS